MKTWPADKVYWYETQSPNIHINELPKTAEVVVIGGGMTGLTCAQALRRAGKEVVLVEGEFCGAGASGKSSGFITPDSELGLRNLVSNYGFEQGKKLWEFAKSGLEMIRQNIIEHNLDCDYQRQDSLFIANSLSKSHIIEEEHKTHQSLGYQSHFYTRSALQTIIGSTQYWGAVRYTNTFAINAFAYCQALKQILIKQGVKVFEKTPVKNIIGRQLSTTRGSIKANQVVVCTDRWLPSLRLAKDAIYHAQTFLSISSPLSVEQTKKIFTEQPLMVWDTDLIYQYFRLTPDRRLLIGAADLMFTYYPAEYHRPRRVVKKIYRYWKEKFPNLPLQLEYLWPGLIGISKDFAPIAGQVKKHPSLYFAGAGAGLPWSAALGQYLSDKITHGRDELDNIFSPERHFVVNAAVQRLITKPVAFAVSHGVSKYIK